MEPLLKFHVWVFMTLILASSLDLSHTASSNIQPSHSSGVAFYQETSVGETVKNYKILNSGRVTRDSATPTSTRYLGPSHGESILKRYRRRTRRDVDTPIVGAVFNNFGNYTPFGNSASIHMPTFTDGDFDFKEGIYSVPYNGAFFFLVHGPVFENIAGSISMDLGWYDSAGVRTIAVNESVTLGAFGVLPVVLALTPEDEVDVKLKGAPVAKAEISSIFNVFDLYHFNVIPTHTCFSHLMRQSAFTAIWSKTISAVPLFSELQLRDDFTTITNIGSHFDVSTGTYTAELPGIYAFFLSFRVSEMPGSTAISITRNGEQVALASAETSQNDARERASTALVMKLSPGDEIQLIKAAATPPITADDDTLLVFTGFLL